MAVCERERQNFRFGTFADEDRAVPVEVRHGTIPSRSTCCHCRSPVYPVNRCSCDTKSSR
jgi:hypothetical protein